ncbi:MAG: tRNA pseudouridine(38-40) synthase TruA [Clostridiaceae bacterium]
MRNIKLIMEFDGTEYAGWQRQINGTAIEQVVREAIKKLTGEEPDLIGCSRTDSGVHARKYVCNFKTHSTIPADRFKFALNSILKEDIVVLESSQVDDSFHSRFGAKSKRYTYTICNREVPPAIGRDYVYHFRKSLDVEKMANASTYLVGKHDFSSFKSSNSSAKTNVRTIYDISVSKDGGNILISVTGDGFLYNMVRIIAGTLIEVGLGERSPEEMKDIIEAKDRSGAGRTAPPSGLCLEEVFY